MREEGNKSTGVSKCSQANSQIGGGKKERKKQRRAPDDRKKRETREIGIEHENVLKWVWDGGIERRMECGTARGRTTNDMLSHMSNTPMRCRYNSPLFRITPIRYLPPTGTAEDKKKNEKSARGARANERGAQLTQGEHAQKEEKRQGAHVR